jgi:hypothetical protein
VDKHKKHIKKNKNKNLLLKPKKYLEYILKLKVIRIIFIKISEYIIKSILILKKDRIRKTIQYNRVLRI